LAHEKATNKHTDKNKKEYFTAENKKYVEKYLAEKFSPEQIVGRAIIDGISCVSHETIYKYIWKDKKANGKRYRSLRNKGKRYRKRGGTKDTRGLIVGRVDIAQRPAIVDRWDRLGDLEIDLVIGKNHKNHKRALLTINDRVTGMLFMRKVSNKLAIEIEKKQ
jgi:IS30 family transposase